MSDGTGDLVRYGDTDRQGHVNNAVFSAFLDTGRVPLFFDPDRPLAPEGTTFVVAGLTIDFRAEITWPGQVDIGTAIKRIGNSSVTVIQGLFTGDICAAVAETTVVLIDNATRRPLPFPQSTRDGLAAMSYRPTGRSQG